MHRVTQTTLLHQPLHVGDLSRDGGGGSADLLGCQLSHLRDYWGSGMTYWNEAEICDAGFGRLEGVAVYVSHDEYRVSGCFLSCSGSGKL